MSDAKAVLHFDFGALPQAARYKLLTGTVVPRPIAWVTTLDAQGGVNLAPFSFFNVMGSDPPILAFAPGDRPDGTPKDTALNIPTGAEFTVNLVSMSLAAAMSATATDFPHALGEAHTLGIALAPGRWVRVPRVQDSPAALECREVQTVKLGRTRIILGQVLGLSIQESAMQDAGRYHVNTAALDLIGRMAGLGGYTRTRDGFHIPRVSYEQWQQTQNQGEGSAGSVSGPAE